MSEADKETIASMARDWNRDHDELQARIAELEAEVERLREENSQVGNELAAAEQEEA